jgi:YidC/Oxa1 family membrane protein insertase
MMTVKGALVYDGEGITTVFEDEDVEGRATFSNVQLISAFGQYFASIVYNLEHDINVIVDRDRDSNPIVYFDAKSMMTFSGYLGPKEYATLKGIDPVLTNAIEYGFFTFISAPMFTVLFWLHGIFGNWGWSIIALTAIIRLLMFPLTFKGMMSMQRMKEIAPRVKEVQAKYKGDPQRMNAAVMELYKKHNANPLGGCLPMILQIPVFFAIYRVLLNAVELQGASWLVWSDLSRMDPWFVLPILMGATMFYQQHITPNNFTDPMQAKVFKWLPVVFTFFFITFPAGLVLYWLVNNIFSILQQYIVNVRFEAAKAERHEQHLAEKHHDKN